MKLIDLLIKANTLVIAFALMASLIGSPFFFRDIQNTFAGNTGGDEEEISAVVAGAFTEAEPTPTPTNTPTPTPLPVAEPVRIEIPNLAIDTTVTRVGVTADNIMEVPMNFEEVGWFDQSLKPGESGQRAAIMSGHFDRVDGSAAIFYLLETVEAGDEVIVTSADGTRYIFAVTSSFSHPLEDFPSDIVYGEVQDTTLKIITCDGIWHPGNASYSDRLVVTTKLIRAERPEDTPAEPIEVE